MAERAEWKNRAYEICGASEDAVGFDEIPPPGLKSAIRLATRLSIASAGLYLKSLWRRERFTHASGVGAFGIARIVENDRIPKSEYFKANRLLSVYLRHGNLMDPPTGRHPDDRCLNIRSASIKLNMESGKSVDFVMNTGNRCPFWNGPTVRDFAERIHGGPRRVQEWLRINPLYFFNTVQGLRKAPDSYASLSYYSQMAYELTDVDGDVHYVRFRLVLDRNQASESGLPSYEDQRKFYERNEEIYSFDDEPDIQAKPINYLRTEFKRRFVHSDDDDAVSASAASYRLQIQVHPLARHSTQTERLDLFNMGKAWLDDEWHDLATIDLHRLLDDDRVEQLQFDVGNLPPCLALPDAPSYEDYRSIGHLRKRLYSVAQWGRLVAPARRRSLDEAEIEYQVTVTTMASKRGGYAGRAFLSILGSRRETGFVELHGSGIIGRLSRFREGKAYEFTIAARDVGTLEAVEFYLDNSLDGWYIAKVSVDKAGDTALFPAYRWIYGHGIIRLGEAKLIFDDCGYLKVLRELEKQKWRDLLPWHTWEDMPSHAAVRQHADLPRDLQFLDEKMVFFYEKLDEGKLNMLYNKIRDWIGAPLRRLGQIQLLRNIFHWEDEIYHYSRFFHFHVGNNEIPEVAKRWFTDKEYGRQFLQGSHPTAFRRVVDKIPDKFRVTGDDVRGVLGRGVTLEQAIRAGHVYIVDCKELEGIPTAEGRFIVPAMGLFYVNAADEFVPMAIQLGQESGPHCPLWTPQDSVNDWLLAKMWLRCADSQIHQMKDHLLLTHLVMEPFVISMYRNLPSVHPIHKLLLPHVRYTIAINTIGRLKLVGQNGLADQVLSIGCGGHIRYIKECYKRFNFDLLFLDHALDDRRINDDVDDDRLPRYYYRDDARRLWRVLQQYVDTMVKVYYENDDAVVRDTEIQDWIKEVCDVGLPWHGEDGGEAEEEEEDVDSRNRHNVPSRIPSRARLVRLLTCIIYTCSAQHAAQNFGQYDYYAFYPNAPMTMRRPPPTEKGNTVEDIVATLGDSKNVSMQLITVWLLATLGPEEIYLGDFPEEYIVEEEASVARNQLRTSLVQIEAEITERNRGLEVPYTYLLPSRVPRSIAV